MGWGWGMPPMAMGMGGMGMGGMGMGMMPVGHENVISRV